MYFLSRLHPPALQSTLFGFANYTGLIAAMLLLLLLLISNDVSLRNLGLRRWKTLQRFSYFAFVVTVAHGVAYQVIEKRPFPWVLLFGLTVLVSVTAQAMAFRRLKVRLEKP
jgi:sulfoxide reductase heme-binding subunit YedZ